MNLEDKIFLVNNEVDFSTLALKVYAFQQENCVVYREFIQQLGKKYPTTIEEIPFLPISFFKTHDVITDSKSVELTFLSSGTTGSIRSKHLVHKASLYERSFLQTYRQFFGNPEEQVILALLPNYLEQGNSSLVYMVQELIKQTNNNLSGFLLDQPQKIISAYEQALLSGKKVVIFGVSYALLDLAEQKVDLSEAVIIETGGMKGRRKEVTKEELHVILKDGLKVSHISSEYGMTELLSQAYSDKNGIFETPPWMKIFCRDTNDPFSYVETGKTGGINVIDLANIYSCSFIATQDLGKIENDHFRIMGRFDNSDLRGCNLMIE